MYKAIIGLAAAGGIALASAAVPSPANARCFGCAVGAGVLGGVVAGTIIGNAIANSPPPPPAYGPPPPPPGAYPPPPDAVYAEPPPAYAQLAPGCYWGKRRVYVEGIGYRVRTVPICP